MGKIKYGMGSNNKLIFYWSLFLILAMTTGCAKVEPLSLESLPVIAGHGGSGFHYLIDPFNPLPSNSLASVSQALIDGAEGIELDVQLSEDSRLILYHDNRLESSTGENGCIGSLPAENVLGLKYKLGFPYDLFHKEVVIGLDQLSDFFLDVERSPLLYLDLKPEVDCSEINVSKRFDMMAMALNEWINSSACDPKKISLIAPYPSLLLKCRALMPAVTLLLAGESDHRSSLSILKKNQLDGLIYPVGDIGEEAIDEIKGSNCTLILFGGKSGKTLRKMISSGADVVQVNHVKKAVLIKESFRKRSQ